MKHEITIANWCDRYNRLTIVAENGFWDGHKTHDNFLMLSFKIFQSISNDV